MLAVLLFRDGELELAVAYDHELRGVVEVSVERVVVREHLDLAPCRQPLWHDGDFPRARIDQVLRADLRARSAVDYMRRVDLVACCAGLVAWPPFSRKGERDRPEGGT